MNRYRSTRTKCICINYIPKKMSAHVRTYGDICLFFNVRKCVRMLTNIFVHGGDQSKFNGI